MKINNEEYQTLVQKLAQEIIEGADGMEVEAEEKEEVKSEGKKSLPPFIQAAIDKKKEKEGKGESKEESKGSEKKSLPPFIQAMKKKKEEKEAAAAQESGMDKQAEEEAYISSIIEKAASVYEDSQAKQEAAMEVYAEAQAEEDAAIEVMAQLGLLDDELEE